MGSQELPPTAQLMQKKLSIAAHSASMDVPVLRTLVSDFQKVQGGGGWRRKKKKGCGLVSNRT